MATRRKQRATRVGTSVKRGASHLPSRVQRILEKRRLRGPNSLTVKEEVELFHFYQLEHDPAGEQPRLSSASRSTLRSAQFAFPEERALPIHDAAHVRYAAARLEQMRLGHSLTRAEYNEARKRILRAGKHFGIRSGSTRDFDRTRRRDAVDLWSESPMTIEQLYDKGYIDAREVREWVRRTAQTRGLIYEPIYRLSRGLERLRLRRIS